MLTCDWLVSPIRNTQGFGLRRSESLRTNYLENIYFAATAHHKNIFPADTNRRINAIVNWIILKVNDLPVNTLIFVLWVGGLRPTVGEKSLDPEVWSSTEKYLNYLEKQGVH